MEQIKPNKNNKKSKQKQQIQKQNKQQEEQTQQSETPNSIYEKNNKFYLVIQAKPNAKKSQLFAITDDSIELSLAAQPIDGQANAELLQFICEILDIKKRNVSLDKGSKSRHKVVEISDSDFSGAKEIYEVLIENSNS